MPARTTTSPSRSIPKRYEGAEPVHLTLSINLRTFVRQLRKKLEEDPAEPVYLLADSHAVYRLAEAKPEPIEAKA
jgi:hypothetical protein